MAIDQTVSPTVSPWEAMEIEANETTPTRERPRSGFARSFTRTAVLVVLAALLILVLLPALIAAQAAVVV